MSREVAALRDLVAQVERGERTPRDAILALPAGTLGPTKLSLDVDPSLPNVYRGVPAGPGVAGGKLVFRPEDAAREASLRNAVLLVVEETFPEDIAAMTASRGIVAVRGGLTGHAAIVSRGLGRPCLWGGSGMSFTEDPATRARALRIELLNGQVLVLREGEIASFDGGTGVFVAGAAPLRSFGAEVDTLLGWATAIAQGAAPEGAAPRALTSFQSTDAPPGEVMERAKKALAA